MPRAIRRDDLAEELDAALEADRRVDLRRARVFFEVDRDAHFVHEACASVREWGQRHGYSPHEASRFAAVGKALALKPELEELILTGQADLDGVAALAKILSDPALVREGEDWVEMMRRMSTTAFQRAVRERLVEARDGGPATQLNVTLSCENRRKFDRAREVASRKAGAALDEGQTIGVISDFYLDAFDGQRKKAGKRRSPDTTGRPGRHVPEEVKREVRGRGDGFCPFPGCLNHIWLDFMHRDSHASGGSREAPNVMEGCRKHHTMLDFGWIKVTGPSDDPTWWRRVRDEDGNWSWERVEGPRDPPG